MKRTLSIFLAMFILFGCIKKQIEQRNDTDKLSRNSKAIVTQKESVLFRPTETLIFTTDENINRQMLEKYCNKLGNRISEKQKEDLIVSTLALVPSSYYKTEERPVASSYTEEEEPICPQITYKIGNCGGFDGHAVIEIPGLVWDTDRCLFNWPSEVTASPKYKCVTQFTKAGVQASSYAPGNASISVTTADIPVYCTCSH